MQSKQEKPESSQRLLYQAVSRLLCSNQSFKAAVYSAKPNNMQSKQAEPEGSQWLLYQAILEDGKRLLYQAILEGCCLASEA